MDLIQALFVGILPASVLMWIGNLIRMRANNGKSGIRWLWFLLGGFGISVLALVIFRLLSDSGFALFAVMLSPIAFGFAAASVLYLIMGHRHWLQNRIKTTTISLLVLLLLLTWITISNDWSVFLSPALVGIMVALVWLTRGQVKKWRSFLYGIEILLLGSSIRVADANRLSEVAPTWLGSMISLGMYVIVPGIAVVTAALFVHELLSNEQSLPWHTVIVTSIMVLILFMMVAYQAMLISIWDVATDSAGWIILWLSTSTLGIGSSMLMAWSIPRRQIWGAIVFALIVPLVLIQARNIGTYDKDHKWGTTPIITTEQRAKKIDQAIQQYYEKNKQYPQTLNDLIPWYIPHIPNPFIIPGQDWCYEGGDGYYRFGYLYRQFFSLPVSVRIHSSMGEPPDINWQCQKDADKYPHAPGF